MVHIRCGCDFPIVLLFLAPSQVPDNTDSGFRSYWASLLFLQKAFWLSWPPNRCIPFFCTSLGTLPRTKRLIHLSCQTVSFKLALFKVRSGILLVHLGSSLGDDRAILVIPNIKFLSVYDDIKTQFFLPVHLTKNTKNTYCMSGISSKSWLHTTALTTYYHNILPYPTASKAHVLEGPNLAHHLFRFPRSGFSRYWRFLLLQWLTSQQEAISLSLHPFQGIFIGRELGTNALHWK